MNEQFRPSKQFIIRGAVAIGALAIILLVQTDWFRALFNKPPLPPLLTNKTVGEFVGQDTNGNEIPDWEEKLWGLDPTVLYTDGIPNKTIIEQKKAALGISEATEPENETDALARELFSITTALGQSGEIDDESLAAIGQQLANSIEFGKAINYYSLKDLQTLPTTPTSLATYYDRFSTLAATYDTAVSELDLLVTALETGDLTTLESLPKIKADYEQYAKALISIETPVGVQKTHLDITNSMMGLSLAVHYMADFSDNAANTLAGVALYKIHDARLTLALTDLRSYFVKYGILDQ